MRELRSRAMTGDSYGTLDANDSLQFAIYRAAKTHILLRLVETLRMQSMPHCAASLRRAFAERPPFLAETLDHSEAVVKALARGDAREAREAKRRDLEGLRAWVERCAAEESASGRVTALAGEREPSAGRRRGKLRRKTR
jgi:DNA-binding GntR family transcriptional regulator